MSRRRHLASLRNSAPAVLPSLLLCDFANLEREVRQLEKAGVTALHLDVMDGRFVPNLTYGMPIVEGLRGVTDLPLDVHLMINTPDKYLQPFYDAGADAITIHAEAIPDDNDVPKHLDAIRKLGAAAGITVNPQTPLATIENCVGHCDLVLIMSVNAGFGGQSFQPVALEKLAAARDMFGPDVVLEVDGGVNADTIASCVEQGAEFLVVGSAITRSNNYSASLADLRQRSTEAAH